MKQDAPATLRIDKEGLCYVSAAIRKHLGDESLAVSVDEGKVTLKRGKGRTYTAYGVFSAAFIKNQLGIKETTYIKFERRDETWVSL